MRARLLALVAATAFAAALSAPVLAADDAGEKLPRTRAAPRATRTTRSLSAPRTRTSPRSTRATPARPRSSRKRWWRAVPECGDRCRCRPTRWPTTRRRSSSPTFSRC